MKAYIMLRIPAIKCSQTTKANTYQTAMRINELVAFLLGGADPRSQNWKNLNSDVRAMYEKLQRTTSKSRRDSMVKYYKRRMAPGASWIGAVPPLVVGMRMAQPFVVSAPDESDTVGYLKVQTHFDKANVLLDGLGRVTGFLDMIDEKGESADWAGEVVLPIMLVTPPDGQAELSHDELGQLFHDMNTLAKPVSQGQAVDLDKSDPYIQVTNRIADLAVIAAQGGVDDRATSISKKGTVWTTKTILLKAVRAASEGPGSHVDHIREEIEDAFMQGAKQEGEILARFEDALEVFIDALPNKTVPTEATLLRKPAWWMAFGLLLHDLHRNYGGERLSNDERERLLRRVAAIDWGLGNPEFHFLGSSVEDKKTGVKPIDDKGREVINQFHGGAKAFYNLAAMIRQKISLKDKVTYGADYGSSLSLNSDGAAQPAVAAE